eukprot:jgi/Chlat1/2935/Chrsp2S04641
MRRVYVARHGERIDFVDPGWVKRDPRPQDPHLTEAGREQASALGRRLKEEYGLGADAIIYVLGVSSLRVEQGLCEWLNAPWYRDLPTENQRNMWMTNKQLHEKVSKRVEVGYESWYNVPVSEKSVKYETMQDMLARGRATVTHLAELHEGDKLVCIGHGASCEAFVLGLVPNASVPSLDYTALSVLEYTNTGWTAPLIADAKHIGGKHKNIRYA